MSVTIEDFQTLQAQLLELKTKNYNLLEQIEAAKKRSNLSPQQVAENFRNENLQIRVKISQSMKEREQLTEQLKFVKISKFLQAHNLYESNTMPDINTIPTELHPIATEVAQLIDDVKQQIVRRAFLDTQVNELGKKTKSLGRTGEQLQQQLSNLRIQQKTELASVDESREIMQKLESETNQLREAIKVATASQQNSPSTDDLKTVLRKISSLEQEIEEKKTIHLKRIEELQSKIAEYDRKLEDSESSKRVIEKKVHQKIWALQNEINKRRGIVVHSSKTAPRKDSAQMFLESKDLIGQIAKKQQEVWELEERVSFSKNSLVLMAQEIVKKLIGGCDERKAKQMREVSVGIVVSLAEINRKKKEILEKKKNK
ncbi:hypothetical protein GPJ56_010758 [Histomonas meleagridis]|uniref:uncharacterized protein n=1 Tax=Histomonas meleagridis TaxID=135588 RepID=UPI003559C447|nr:hypothetical protein GPJ56_010758 [Histomonas meleagridis]KAH0801094.1 hypothetical protein GO595_006129 [Histomonas meleagridis]